MNLVQKLPLGLALATCIMMSSCSQEDVAQPQKNKMENGFSSERGGGPLQGVPQIPATDASPGHNVFATGWIRAINASPDDLELYAAGTSTKTHLWGDQSYPWTKPLLQPSGYNSNKTNNFVTIMAQSKVINGSATNSKAISKIKNLKVGKKYAVTISVASTVYLRNGEPTQYAPAAMIQIPGTIGVNWGITKFDLNGKQAEWVTKTIVFEAQDIEAQVFFASYFDEQYTDSHDKYLTYMHAFVAENAIVEIP
ncbi:MAG: hypothetical protein J7619_03200 [Dyadobacter sp.]|uniref:hypothetical protein n=1 Tax=Dyadobacter sp. TaxID=1914288 RepID=UPI001B15C580|nr:hypothetical protein [Dyadobacter sp.]MBO9611673.1 hypothetical protein [Dyadobacter sp.]